MTGYIAPAMRDEYERYEKLASEVSEPELRRAYHAKSRAIRKQLVGDTSDSAGADAERRKRERLTAEVARWVNS